jgi:FKBP-type peptidyl-prolyl cis-trans isomerase SlyD
MSLLIGNDLVVSIHYTLTDDEGTVLDSSEGKEPLAYLHGAGNIIPGLENALAGKTQGDSCKVRVQPEEGYGERVPELVQQVPRAAFEGVDSVEVGMVFHAQTPTGQMQQVVVREVSDDEITVDGNHPLAGQPLNFDVEIVSVRDASADELSHGHVH